MPSLTIQNHSIPYTLNPSTRAKRLSMRRTVDRGLVVTQPKRITDSQVKNFLIDKSSRILKHHQRKQDHQTTNPDIATHDRKHFLHHKVAAHQLAVSKVEQWSTIIPYSYNTIRVKQHKTKRGSCSSKKNLNFNYKILFLPQHLQDYLVVHEMCHLKEMNHSPRFRALIQKYYGPYQAARKSLKQY